MVQFLFKFVETDFLQCTTISIDLTAKFHSLYVKESEILERSESQLVSDILPPTSQRWLHGPFHQSSLSKKHSEQRPHEKTTITLGRKAK